MAGQNTLTFTDASFDKDIPVLVDFWAEGCPPCRKIAPTIDLVASEYAGKAKVGKLDTVSNGNTAMRYRIQSIPTLLLFKGGKVVAESLGAISKTEAHVMLDAHL